MAEPIGVLHLVDCLNIGGTERQLFELVRRLDRRRYRSFVACFNEGGELDPMLRDLGIAPFGLPLHGTLARPNTVLQILRLALACRKNRVRILHAHDFYSNLIGVAAARLAGIRAIASRRDLGHWLSPRHHRVLRIALKHADRVLANAHAVGRLVLSEEEVAPPKLRVIPNGIDLTRFDALARRAPDPPLLPAHPGVPRLCAVASMHLPDKGHGDLLDAAAALEARGVRVEWLLLSDGGLRETYQARARELGLGESIHFLGRRGDVPSLLARVDLVVHPSWAEGFPNAVLEAMAAARPVVATRVGGTPELVVEGETGYLVDPRQPAALADAIVRALADRDRLRQLGERGRARVESTFSAEQMIHSVESLYAELAPGS